MILGKSATSLMPLSPSISKEFLEQWIEVRWFDISSKNARIAKDLKSVIGYIVEFYYKIIRAGKNSESASKKTRLIGCELKDMKAIQVSVVGPSY